jgi:hypothetical protein
MIEVILIRKFSPSTISPSYYHTQALFVDAGSLSSGLEFFTPGKTL